MGTDIHAVVQVRGGEGAPWRTVYVGDDYPWHDEHPLAFLNQRNYLLFAVLAGVRNGYGFAGVFTQDAVKPIAEPRGLPSDMGDPPRYYCRNVDFRRYAEEDGSGCPGHDEAFRAYGASWVTLRELIEYPWDQPLRRGGVVPAPTYDRWKASGALEPTWWCGDTSGPMVPEAGYRSGAREDIAVCCRWTVPLGHAVGGASFVALLEALRALGDPDDVRIVFGFDS